jgi:hypothetical protein
MATTARRGAVSKFPQEATEQVVTIIWHDSYTVNGPWVMRHDNLTDAMTPVTTIGFLVAVDEEWITIAQSLAEEQLGQVFRLPKGCIIDLTVHPLDVQRPQAVQ